MTRPSPFLYAPPKADAESLAILHLKRDSLIPVQLQSTADDGYAEGAVTNTRFGSFPHSTIIGLEWGSQVRASKVDTGSRGRKGKKAKPDDNAAQQNGGTDGQDSERSSKKRKSEGPPQDIPEVKKLKTEHPASAVKSPLEAGSGFIHILPPTPEAWTSSLDHRTQVVYTPDYSYILQRLRVRPGCRIIEAGAGSGSFTHASARAIFNGCRSEGRDTGKVFSFEYHEPRVHTLRDEISSHGLEGIVELTHRDVYNDGFVLQDGTAPSVDAVFLDLPAPWKALTHLSRSAPNTPLNPNSAIHLCTFSPCIEQVMATCSFLRKAGWIDISMSEVQHKRIDVRRERVGLKEEGLRGVNASAASVSEAIGRLREVENKLSAFHHIQKTVTNGNNRQDVAQEKKTETKTERLERIKREADERKLYKEGNLVSRTEPEVKTHTSFLVFAVLPREWTEENEAALEAQYPVDEMMKGSKGESEAKS